MGGLGGGRTGLDSDPNHDGTESPLLLLSQWSMGEETRRVDGRSVDFASVDEVTDLGTDSVPDAVQRGVKDAAERPNGDRGVSASGLGEWHSEEIGTVDEFWVVAIASDTIIVGGPLVFVGGVLGYDGRITGEGESRGMGRHGLVAQEGRAGALPLIALEVDALESKQRELWTERW